jgi:hypothetical protein
LIGSGEGGNGDLRSEVETMKFAVQFDADGRAQLDHEDDPGLNTLLTLLLAYRNPHEAADGVAGALTRSAADGNVLLHSGYCTARVDRDVLWFDWDFGDGVSSTGLDRAVADEVLERWRATAETWWADVGPLERIYREREWDTTGLPLCRFLQAHPDDWHTHEEIRWELIAAVGDCESSSDRTILLSVPGILNRYGDVIEIDARRI